MKWSLLSFSEVVLKWYRIPHRKLSTDSRFLFCHVCTHGLLLTVFIFLDTRSARTFLLLSEQLSCLIGNYRVCWATFVIVRFLMNRPSDRGARRARALYAELLKCDRGGGVVPIVIATAMRIIAKARPWSYNIRQQRRTSAGLRIRMSWDTWAGCS